ncbi:MAG: tetratricopeptide repeat protein [Alphaproteobacteria bacterium]
MPREIKPITKEYELFISDKIIAYHQALIARNQNEIRKLFYEILEEDEKFSHLLESLDYLLTVKDYKEAIRSFNKIISYYPSLKILYIFKVSALYEMNNNEAALKTLETLFEIDKEYMEAYLYKLKILGKMNLFNEALECCDKIHEIDEAYHPIYYSKGVILYKLKRYDEAVSCFDQYLKNNSADLYVWKIKEELSHALCMVEEIYLCNQIIPVIEDLYELSNNTDRISFKKFVKKIDDLPVGNAGRGFAINVLIPPEHQKLFYPKDFNWKKFITDKKEIQTFNR